MGAMDQRHAILRPSARIGDAVLHGDVGAVLLLWNPSAPRALHVVRERERHEEHEERTDSIVGEPLPHLREEQRRQSARMAEESRVAGPSLPSGRRDVRGERGLLRRWARLLANGHTYPC